MVVYQQSHRNDTEITYHQYPPRTDIVVFGHQHRNDIRTSGTSTNRERYADTDTGQHCSDNGTHKFLVG